MAEEQEVRNLFDLHFDVLYVHNDDEADRLEYGEKYESRFLKDGCCKKECWKQFSEENIIDSRMSSLEMKYYCPTHINHHHVYVMGKYFFLCI